jgi:hypothetical protein
MNMLFDTHESDEAHGIFLWEFYLSKRTHYGVLRTICFDTPSDPGYLVAVVSDGNYTVCDAYVRREKSMQELMQAAKWIHSIAGVRTDLDSDPAVLFGEGLEGRRPL